MDFGLITEGNTLGGTLTVQQRYQEIVEAAVLADKCGFYVFGAGEQHFVEPLCTISSGEIILACLAKLTQRIRLRTTIMVLPFHNPVAMAERIASIDVLSGGRVEFGSGKGNNVLAADVFDVDLSHAATIWREELDVMIKAWSCDRFSHDGAHYKIPDIRLSPNVLQKPHPPLWSAAISPASHAQAGRLGMGVMSLTVSVTLPQLERRIAAYKDAIRHAEPLAGVVNDRVSVFCQMHCAETDELAREQARDPMLEYMREAVDLYAEMLHRQGQQVDFTKTRETISDFDLCDRTNMILVGKPETLIEKIRQYETIGVDEMFIRMDGMPHEQTMRSIELIGKHVIPAFNASPRAALGRTGAVATR